MKIAILQTRLSPYFVACLRELKQQTAAELLIYAWPNQPNAPFDSRAFADLGKVFNRYEYSNNAILNQLLAFSPSAVLTSGWKDKGYVGICRRLKSHHIPIIAGCDTQWKGSWRQHIASCIAPFHVQKFIDILWVTGERQRYLAKGLGFDGDRCWDGYYACDWDAFATQPKSTASGQHPYFLYVGRYVPEKGLDTLAAAYQAYCEQVQEPWLLVCAGSGALGNRLISAGAKDKGFVQPKDLPALMQGASAFVLPSRSEPWGVVVQEAAASGLPLILSDACGAGVHLLRSYHNGFSFPHGSIMGLTQALKAMHLLTPEQRLAYGQASYELSKQYTPQRWTKTLLEGLQQLQTAMAKGARSRE
ncbi:MAG: glycosyltransferase family 4 protein [Moorea sp. SIO2I5]|nr:glycosyltransferase family 4 protein [Moorena sp. SIO2I5]